MKNFSAPKLLRMALARTHISYCPHVNDKIPGYECICWKHEVNKWDVRTKLTASTRIRKPKPHKIHFNNHTCSARIKGTNVMSWSNDIKDITCNQCLNFANRPTKSPKLLKAKKKQNSTVDVFSDSSYILTPTAQS